MPGLLDGFWDYLFYVGDYYVLPFACRMLLVEGCSYRLMNERLMQCLDSNGSKLVCDSF